MKQYKNAPKYRISRVGMDKKSIRKSFKNNLLCTLAKDKFTATYRDNFMALAIAIRDRLAKRWIATQQRYHRKNKKRVYYLSMEFLIGRLLGNNLLNLGIWDEAEEVLNELGLDFEEVRKQETDAGLGNGGLGRLAACFLDSLATLNIPAHGYGIRYDYGMFHQKIKDGRQIELPDEWLKFGYPWEFERPEYNVRIQFYGNIEFSDSENGGKNIKWVNTDDVLAIPYDVPVSGYKNNIVNTLRLWSARGTEEFDFNYFNHGDYGKAVEDKIFSENISKILYPDDSMSRGKELRLKQEYFFTAASLADIIRRFKEENSDLRNLPKKAVIQLNDTHPALAIPELMRILIDQENLTWDVAWKICSKTFAYTNHTIMPEALESWSVILFEKVLPRHLQIIYEINFKFLKYVAKQFPQDESKLGRVSIIEEGEVKNVCMAHLCIVGSYSVNGVSEIHTSLLKTRVFKDFYDIFPNKFNNKTNGVTHRRWLLKSNHGLSALITDTIGDSWITNLNHLKKLLPYKDDCNFQKEWSKVKKANKKILAEHIKNTQGIIVNPESLFDVHIKRIHEYKRQVLFGLYIISEYLSATRKIKKDILPRTFLLAGKAAPGYFMAKLIIKFINNIARTINNDKSVKNLFKVVFLENYRVSLAEKIFPASDLSEQISTAGTEASGTGCMKFMLNGALTIGTLDGANIEMAQECGAENIFMFGLSAEKISQLKNEGYNPNQYIEKYPLLKEIINLIRSDFFSPSERGIFEPIIQSLITQDPFFVCADFSAYLEAQNKATKSYCAKPGWISKSIVNTATSGKFSSDRTIQEYATQIWHAPFKPSE